jgi:hypothetical protein
VNKKLVGEESGGAMTETVELKGITSNPDNSIRGRDLPAGVSVPAVIIGRIAAFRSPADPLVDFPANTTGALVPARSLVAVTEEEVGKEVALVFEDSDPAKPVIIGIMQDSNQMHAASPNKIAVDEDSLILSAKKEVVIRCGKASITLTSAGKVLIRGAYLLSRSSGVNRIKGGSVQIN